MQSHHAKRIAAGLLAAALTLPAAVSPAATLSASAYELLGETEFTHKMIPWITVENSPAKQEFTLRDGDVHIYILNPAGLDRSNWDLQFRHGGLSFKAGHEYKVSFKAKAQRTGMELVSQISDSKDAHRYFVLDGMTGDMHMGPDMGGQWGNPLSLTNEYTEYSGTFKPTEDIVNAQWVFWYAQDDNGYGGNAQAGDELWFDDMSIEDLTDPDYIPPENHYGLTSRSFSGLENNYISVNQLGYFPGLAKTAVLGDNGGDPFGDAIGLTQSGGYDYEIVKTSDNTVAYSGKTGAPVKDPDSGDTVCKIDFTAFDEPGEYYIRIKGKEWRSFPFRIDKDVYHTDRQDLLTDALNDFYQNRAGTDVEVQYISSGDKAALAHSKNLNDTFGFVQTEWRTEAMSAPEDAEKQSSSRLDTGGGWYTGDNFDKDMTAGGLAVWTLQNLYERAAQEDAATSKFLNGYSILNIPESRTDYPDILEECRYELDFMAKMKVQQNEPAWGDYAGLYYHALEGVGFTANQPDYEHEYHAAYAVQPPTFAATLNYAACAAQGARLWAQFDPDYAAELLQSAADAYEAYRQYYYPPDLTGTTHPDGWLCVKETLNPQSLYAPESLTDGDFEVRDDAYWAACELYISAKELNADLDAQSYLKDLSDYKNAFQTPSRITGGGNENTDGSLTLFNQGNTAANGSLSLLLHDTLIPADQAKVLRRSVVDAADAFMETQAHQGYGIPYIYDGASYADPTGIPTQIMLFGYEYDSNARVLSNLIAMAYAYDLTGDTAYLSGAASGMDYLLGCNPLAFSFITGYGSYHAENPSHGYWLNEVDPALPKAPDGIIVSGPNAWATDPYIRALGFKPGEPEQVSQRCYADSTGAQSVNAASLSSNAALAWIVSFLQDEAPAIGGETVPGDADGSGAADRADAALLADHLLGKRRVKSPANADMDQNGILNAVDLTLLKRELMQ